MGCYLCISFVILRHGIINSEWWRDKELHKVKSIYSKTTRQVKTFFGVRNIWVSNNILVSSFFSVNIQLSAPVDIMSQKLHSAYLDSALSFIKNDDIICTLIVLLNSSIKWSPKWSKICPIGRIKPLVHNVHWGGRTYFQSQRKVGREK